MARRLFLACFSAILLSCLRRLLKTPLGNYKQSKGESPSTQHVYKISQHPDTLVHLNLYERLGSEWEHYERLIWQTTTFAITVVGGALLISYPQIEGCVGKISMLTIVWLATWVLFIALQKHRLFATVRSEHMELLELEAYQGKTIPIDVIRDTEKLKAYRAANGGSLSRLERVRAFALFSNSVLLCIVGIPILIAFNLASIGVQESWWNLPAPMNEWCAGLCGNGEDRSIIYLDIVTMSDVSIFRGD